MLRITEIFFSLQGETTFTGLPTVFIRLTGCPLRCQYCDTAYAFKGGTQKSIEEILEEVSKYKTKYITVTGGEPLAQKNCLDLLKQLCDLNYTVSLETSGAIDVSEVDKRIVKILDIKTPGSKEVDKNIYENFAYLNPYDQIKFVICNRDDYEWSKEIISKYPQLKNHEILFSASHDELSSKDLAQWIIDDQLLVRLQIQLHKYLWENEQGR